MEDLCWSRYFLKDCRRLRGPVLEQEISIKRKKRGRFLSPFLYRLIITSLPPSLLSHRHWGGEDVNEGVKLSLGRRSGLGKRCCFNFSVFLIIQIYVNWQTNYFPLPSRLFVFFWAMVISKWSLCLYLDPWDFLSYSFSTLLRRKRCESCWVGIWQPAKANAPQWASTDTFTRLFLQYCKWK